MTNEVFKINMLNGFTITYGEESVDVTRYLGKQLINLFQVLLYYRKQPVLKERLIEILWQNSENPNSVMKFTVFRLRKDIQKISFFAEKELIVTARGGYQLNPEFTWLVDYEKFDEIKAEIDASDGFGSKELRLGYRLVDLYKGKYYVSNSHLSWMLERCDYYRQEYVKIVVKMCGYLLEKNCYDEMMTLNYRATMLEPFYEGLHYYYMKGLLETKDYHGALKYYDDLNEAFLRELGTGLSQRFQELYDVVLKDHQAVGRLDMDSLVKELSVRSNVQGGFYCTFDMFKHIYELTVKEDLRGGESHYLITFEVIKEEEKEGNEICIITNKVKKIISESLRNCDVFTKINDGQYAVLVDCKKKENGYLIIQRISKKFSYRFRNKGYHLNSNIIAATFAK